MPLVAPPEVQAAATLLEVAAGPKHLGAEVGVLAVLHTWGQSLTLHPHVHCVVTGGGLALDGSQWVAGRADFYFAPLINALPLLKDGQLQALAVSGSTRASALPHVPTTVEAGYPNTEYNFWAGVFAPAKTSADVRARLHAEIAKALVHAAISRKLNELGADPMPLTSEQFEVLVRREIETNTQLVKAAGIKVN